jgi:hypothetical protein
VATVDTNHVGVGDMKAAISAVSNYPDWTEDLRNCAADQRAAREASNRRITTKVLMKVLAARMIVFELFLELAVKMDGQLQEKHTHAWLMFQISNVLNRSNPDQHPFIQVNNECLGGASPEALVALVGRLRSIRTKYFPSAAHFFLVVDEAQVAAASSPYAFLSCNDGAKPRSLLREVIRVGADLGNPIIKLIVSGTGLSLETVNEVLASGVGKPATDGGFDVFHDVGSFGTQESQRAYLDRYVPQSVLASSSGQILCKRICNWLLGR